MILSLSKDGLTVSGTARKKIRQLMFDMLEKEKIGRLAGLVQIFGLLAASHELKPISTNQISGINITDSLKMNKVLEYALKNFKSEISIAEAAALVNLSESAFCRYFKLRTQKSFLNFVIEMRLNEARRLLNESEKSVLEICYDSGFNNLSNFNRLFRKKYKQAPREYRKA
jgi:AraC-like DNA-binding protein